jgi:NAD(P)-dependent dehydrogenase (short-subunit alcohol dehydrogenase family)
MPGIKKDAHLPEQLPSRPGRQDQMTQQPKTHKASHIGSGKLSGQVVLVTGGDSGIGRAVAIACAVEGAKVVINYLEEQKDAEATRRMIEEKGGECLLAAGDVGDEQFCASLVNATIERFGRIDVLVNNAAEQHPQPDITGITAEQLERTFRTNIFSMFYMVKAALPYLEKGSSIINTTSVTAYAGNPRLLDYAATKGAIVAFTRSLSLSLADKGIRVNAVAPGPIWTPLIPSTFPPYKVETFGQNVPMERSGEPEEVAPAFIFLASDDASYISGQTIHVNGGTIVNG